MLRACGATAKPGCDGCAAGFGYRLPRAEQAGGDPRFALEGVQRARPLRTESCAKHSKQRV